MKKISLEITGWQHSFLKISFSDNAEEEVKFKMGNSHNHTDKQYLASLTKEEWIKMRDFIDDSFSPKKEIVSKDIGMTLGELDFWQATRPHIAKEND